MPEASHTANTLHEAITSAFDLGELKTLCFDLQVEYDDLPGDTRQEKVRELLRFLERVGRQDELLPRLQQLRPHIPWHTFQPAEPEAESPFKGLHYFKESDAHLFYGREQLTAELLDHLRQHRFLAVVGASGSGKSSLVRAGVIAAVRHGAIELNDRPSDSWPIHLITPGDEPLKALAAAFTRDSESVTALKALLTDLRADAESLDLFLYRQMSSQTEGRVLLVVDQFEELFTQCDDPEERRLFVENLVCAVQSGKQGRLSLILTLRADFYAHAVQYEALRPLLETRQKIVGAMNADELRRAIEAPAAQANWQFQPGLVETMLQDVGREPGALPLLSHALQETWTRREGRVMTLAGYQAAGGVRRAIAQTADTVYASLTPPQQTIARNIFLRLTELGEGTEDTRRRASLTELLPQDDTTAEVQAILDLLARRRLLILNEERAKEGLTQNYAEVTHEALIREWPALRQWLDENREGLRLHRQLTDMVQAWQAAHEDPSYLLRGGRLAQTQEWAGQNPGPLNELEHRFLSASQDAVAQEEVGREAQRQRELEQARRLAQGASTVRRALGVILVLFVVAVVAAVFGFVQSGVASDNLATATIAQGAAQQSLATATIAQGEAQINLTVAIAAQETAVAEGNARATQEVLALQSANLAQQQQAEAERQSRLALAQSLAALSQVMYQDSHDSELAALLAIEAYNMNWAGAGKMAWLLDSTLRPLLNPLPFNHTLRGHENTVWSLAFSPDGQTLASGSFDNTVRLWNLGQPTDEPIVLRDHKSIVSSVAFSPDGQTLASGSANNIYLWDLSQPGNEPLVLSNFGSSVHSVAFSPDGQTLAWGSENSTIWLWDFSQPGVTLVALYGHKARVNSVSFSPNGQTLASGSDDGTIRLWDFNQPETDPVVLRGHEDTVRSLSFSPDGQTLASGSFDNTVRLWNLGQPGVEPVVLPAFAVRAVAFSPDGQTLALGSANVIYLLDLSQSEAEPVVLPGFGNSVWSVAFSPDGQTLASDSGDNTVRLWDLSQRVTEPVVLQGHEYIVSSVTFSPDGQTLASGSWDDTIRLWDLSQPETEPVVLPGFGNSVWSVAFSPDGQTLAWSNEDSTIRLGDLRQPDAEPVMLRGHKGRVNSVSFSPDGRTLASGSNDSTIRLWDLSQPNAEPVVLRGHERWVRSVAFSPDGQTLASGSDDSTIRLWDLSQPDAEPVVLRGHESTVYWVAFSPDGQTLASNGFGSTIHLWDLSQLGAEPVVLHGHEFSVSSVAFSPDRQTLASGDGGGTIHLWDLSQQDAEPVVLRGHESSVNSVAFSPDGQTLASGSSDDTIRLWVLLDELVVIGCQQVWRNLSWDEWQRYLPGEPYRQTCSNWPVHPSVPENARP